MFYNKAIFKRCFNFRKRYWYKNLRYIPLYFKQIHYLVKNGYDEYAVWETFNWFIDVMKPILIEYRDNRHGDPVIIDNYPFDDSRDDEESKRLRQLNIDTWTKIINKMINCLDMMDEGNPKYEADKYDGIEGWKRKDKEMEDAKNKFFELFSEHFYKLWD